MANIHTTKSQGRTPKLGPVTIKKLWPYKGGDKSINGVISDSSGETPFKGWGFTPATGLYEGAEVTFSGSGPKAGITNKEYPEGSGKWAFNISECSVQFGQAGGGDVEHVGYNAPEPSQRPQYPTQPLAVQGDKLGPVMARAALATRLYVAELEAQGFTRDEALMLAVPAPTVFPLWWFGEKGC